jgi:hypothetical protein
MSKKDFVKAIEVKSPCTESWNEMRGNDRIRFCGHCAHDVNNLSEMTRKEAMRLVRGSEGRLCIRYDRHPVTRAPLFSDTFHQITRRAPMIAAGIMTASMALATAAYAQTDGATEPAAQTVSEARSEGTGSTLSGYATDPNGAVLPYALVGLTNEQTNEYRVTNASGEGFYEFKDLDAGNYKLKVEAGGFDAVESPSITVTEATQVRRDAQLSVQKMEVAVQVGGENSRLGEFSVTVGVISCSYSNAPVNKLVEAVYDENLDEITRLIAKGDRVNSKDKNHDGVSPLHAAVETGNIEIVQFLLSSGAKINGRDSLKRTPLMMMDADATPELFQLLLRYGAKIDLVDKQGFTALSYFAGYNQPEMVSLFVSAGANVNAANKQRETPLLIAARSENLDVVKVLLESGANANPRTKTGETAWELTSGPEIRTLLETYGATVRNR